VSLRHSAHRASGAIPRGLSVGSVSLELSIFELSTFGEAFGIACLIVVVDTVAEHVFASLGARCSLHKMLALVARD